MSIKIYVKLTIEVIQDDTEKLIKCINTRFKNFKFLKAKEKKASFEVFQVGKFCEIRPPTFLIRRQILPE